MPRRGKGPGTDVEMKSLVLTSESSGSALSKYRSLALIVAPELKLVAFGWNMKLIVLFAKSKVPPGRLMASSLVVLLFGAPLNVTSLKAKGLAIPSPVSVIPEIVKG